MITCKRLAVLCVICLFGTLSGAARADGPWAINYIENTYTSATVNAYVGGYWHQVGTNLGSFTSNWVGGGSHGGLATGFTAYCADLSNYLVNPGDVKVDTTPTNTVLPISATDWARAVSIVRTYGLGASGQQGAAVQLAVWSVLFGSGTDVTVAGSGNKLFNVIGGAGGASALANTYLSNIVSGNASGGLYLEPIPQSDTQGMMTVVPEASSLALLLPGLLPVAFAIRRRTRRT